MAKWQCQVCEYIYDPEDGEPLTVLTLERPLRIYLTIGCAHPAVQVKTCIRN